MKTRLFSGWKTRAQMLCLAALCGLMTAGVASTAFAAQDTVAPTTEAPATDAAPAPVEAFDFGHGDALHADLRQRLAHVVELERLDNGCD